MVLALVLVTPTPVAVTLLALQTVVFGIGAVRGIQHTPYAWLFRTLVRPRLGAPRALEDPLPPRFAQKVGLGFALVGLLGFAIGVTPLAQQHEAEVEVEVVRPGIERGCRAELVFRFAQ